MKQMISILPFLLLTVGAFATEQETDLLIVDTDTIYLKTFPLESLELAIRPFGNTLQTAPGSACWRGYRAIWRLKDNKLYLEKIIRCSSDREKGEQNIKELFDENGKEHEIKDGMILADWVTQELCIMNFSIANYYKDKIFLYDGWNEKKNNKEKNLRLKIEKGIVKVNRLKKLE